MTSRRCPLAVALLALGLGAAPVAVSGVAAAREATVFRGPAQEPPSSPTVLRAARLLDVETGEITPNASILVEATAGVLSMEGPVGAQQYTLEELRAMVEEAARHGVKVAAHAHGAEGMHAAELLGTSDRGRIAEGLLADIIAVPGNPLDDITVTEDVRFVMLGGRVIKQSL